MFKYRRRLMTKIPAWLRRVAIVALVSASVTVMVVAADPAFAPSGGPTRTAATTTTVPSTPGAPKGLITKGPSRSECLEPNFTDTGLRALESAITSFDAKTDTSVSCISAYLTTAPTWTAWVHPWVTQAQYGYSSWVAQDPQSRQLVLQVDLIPNSLKNVSDPLSWEQSCAAGDFNSYATQLGTNLVAAGLENSVLRLGAEMNGVWEADFIGTTTVEQHLWATCFANEVTALRKAPGGHFLIDWNPNACKKNIPFANFYPGNAYVDILGLDLFDASCLFSRPVTFAQLANEPAGLAHFEAFATAQGKPMSLPEWGLAPTPAGDDPGYIDGIGSTVASGDFAFETYFDANVIIRPYLPLGSRTPLSLAAFQKWFGHDS